MLYKLTCSLRGVSKYTSCGYQWYVWFRPSESHQEPVETDEKDRWNLLKSGCFKNNNNNNNNNNHHHHHHHFSQAFLFFPKRKHPTHPIHVFFLNSRIGLVLRNWLFGWSSSAVSWRPASWKAKLNLNGAVHPARSGMGIEGFGWGLEDRVPWICGVSDDYIYYIIYYILYIYDTYTFIIEDIKLNIFTLLLLIFKETKNIQIQLLSCRFEESKNMCSPVPIWELSNSLFKYLDIWTLWVGQT